MVPERQCPAQGASEMVVYYAQSRVPLGVLACCEVAQRCARTIISLRLTFDHAFPLRQLGLPVPCS